EKALEFFQQALPVNHASTDRRMEAQTLNNIAIAYSCLKQTGKAVEYFLKAADLFRGTPAGRAALASVLSNAGQAYVSLREPLKPFPLLEEALDILRESGNRWDEAYTLTVLAKARLATNDVVGATSPIERAGTLSREVGDPQLEALTHHEAARVERAQ